MTPLSGCGAPIVDRHCSDCGRPALLDAYCCQGGASAGYQRAGFCTTGVDIDPQPRFPWHFIQADAVEFIAAYGHLFAAVHSSPPCQLYSACQRIRGREHLLLCGSMFPELRTYRHRLFETPVPLLVPPHLAHPAPTVKMGRSLREGDWYHAVGNFSGVGYVRNNLGFSWMSRDGLRESIPAQYAELVGFGLMAAASDAVVAA